MSTLFNRYLMLTLFAVQVPLWLNGQVQPRLRDLFLEAESYFLFEEYSEALPLYQQIWIEEPDNYNVAFKIGVCYINDPYQREKSIGYLEKAVDHINPSYKESSFREKLAPPDAFYYLGNAYRINDKLHEAITAYKKFKEILDTKIYDVSLVDKQIRSCEIALDVKSRPAYIKKTILSEDINSRFAEINPVVSGDESNLVFTRKLQFYDAIFYSHKVEGKWSYPVNLTPSFALDGNSYCTGLSWDGTELFVYRSDNFDGNIYVSRRQGDRWSKLIKLNENINTKFWESHASVSPDGLTLYFTSNRKGGVGGLDIYSSRRSSKDRDDWGPAVNLGSNVNSPFNEDTPFITGDGKTLYFSSQGHYTMGGFDIFYSTRLDDGSWSKPLNAGYPINTTGDDLFFVPVRNGEFAYYSMFNPRTGFGLDDIYRLEIFSETHPRKFKLKGKTPLTADLQAIHKKLRVKLLDRKTGQLIDEAGIAADGSFELEAQSGELDLVISGNSIQETKESVKIPIDHPSDQFVYNAKTPITDPNKVPEITIETPPGKQPRLEIAEYQLTVTDNKPIALRLNVDRNTNLLADVFIEGEWLKHDVIDVDRRRLIYLYTPEEGENLIKFTLTDQEGNTNTQEVHITYFPEDKEVISQQDEEGERAANTRNDFGTLSSLTEGMLRDYLELDDFRHLKFASAAELYGHLLEVSADKGFTHDEVDEFFIQYLAGKQLGLFQKALANDADSLLAAHLSSINTDSLKIASSKHLLDYIEGVTAAADFTVKEVEALLKATMDKDQPSDTRILEKLHSYASPALQQKVAGLLSDKEVIPPVSDLKNALLKDSGKYGYTDADIREAFKKAAASIDADFLHQNMLYHSEGDLQKALAETNTEKDQIHTSQQLLRQLFTGAADKGYTIPDVIALAEKVRNNPGAGVVLFRDYLTRHAEGDLKALLASIDLEKEGISTYLDLLNYLINSSKYHNYNREAIYRLLLSLIPYTDLDDFIARLNKHADDKIRRALDKLDRDLFQTPYDVIQYLLANADTYGYTEEEVLKLLLRLILEQGVQEVSVDDEATGFELSRKAVIGGLIGLSGALFLLILFIVLRKRRRDE